MLDTRSWPKAFFAMLLVAGITAFTSVAGAEPRPVISREGEVAQEVINQLLTLGDGDLSLSQIEVDGLGPPPWTSFVPNRDPKAVQAWVLLAERFPELRRGPRQAQASAGEILVVRETEPNGELGQNDTPETGESVTGFGTGDSDTQFARVLGTLFNPPPPPDCESVEDDGAIGTASPTNLDPDVQVQLCTGFVGDGPYGLSSGDFDFYAMNDVMAGQTLIVEVVPSRETNDEPPTTIAIYDSAGERLAEVDDTGTRDEFVFLEMTAPADDTYFAVVAGLATEPSNPFDSSSGNGATTTGAYEVFLVNVPPFVGPDPNCGSAEDDGAIPQASRTDLNAQNQIQLCAGGIGDSPHEDGGGDLDFYAMNTIQAGRTVIAEVVASRDEPFELATTLAIYNSAGERLAEGDDPGGENGPSAFVQVVAPATDEYFVAVSGSGNVPADPFDPSSGSGSDSYGPYEVFIGNLDEPVVNFGNRYWQARMEQPVEGEEDPPAEEEAAPDTDFYLVDLEPGDVISAAFEPAGLLEIYNPDGTLAIGSFGSAAFIYPGASPLRHLGSIGADHVARTAGTYAVGISQSGGPYDGELRVARAGRVNSTGDDAQIIYLDFDGGSVSPSLFDPFASSDEAALSPMIDFFPRWGLSLTDQDAVIDAVVAEVEKELGDHLRAQGTYGDRDLTGTPGEFDIEIRNSRDHADVWGQPNVSRVIVGGTIDELGVPTIGIAQSIDPGNLDSEETAVVMLDVLSDSPEEVGETSLNFYQFAEPFTKADLVGAGIGVIVAHEVGHFVGNWHTETGNEILSIMDAGGDLAGTFGVGPDKIFGTDDDIDVHFVSDDFNVFEGFTGIEDTEARTGFAMLTGPLADAQPPQGLTVDKLTAHSKFGVEDAQVLRLYVAFFNRQPDVSGANYWVSVRYDGSSLQDIAGFFTLSQEFANNYAGTSNAQYVTKVYENVLGRDFDQAGYEYWLGLLDTGALDRGGVVQWISLNQEFVKANPYGGV